MPELPEVETLRQELALVLVGKKIKSASCDWPKMVRPLSVKNFCANLVGQKIKAVDRRAKVLIITLASGEHILVHLKMTGQLIFKSPSQSSGPAAKGGQIVVGGHPQPGGADGLPNKFTRIVLEFTDSSTLFHNDMRKFGWSRLVSETEKNNLLAGNGPEPLSSDFSLKYFKEILAKYPKRKLKQILLDQTLIAGIGNIYADEAAFLAKVLPMRLAGTLNQKEIADRHKFIIKVLKHSISKKGTSAKNYLRSDGSKGGFVPYLYVYGRGKLACKVCSTPISKIKLNGRGTHFCPKCQK